MVCSLVLNYGQQIDTAWRFTTKEFMALCTHNQRMKDGSMWDHERADDLEAHLKNMGVI